MSPRVTALTFTVLGAGLIGTWCLLAFAAPRDDADGAWRLVLRFLWAAVPYAVVAVTARLLARTPARRLVVLAGAGGIAVSGVAVLYDGLVRHPGPVAYADILLLPAYQLVLAFGVLLFVAALTLRRPVPAP